jgi:AraC family transcriptional regulator
MASLAPRIESADTILLAGLSGRYSTATSGQIPELWWKWGSAWLGRTPGQVDKRCYGVCWDFDGKGSFDYLAGVEVGSFDEIPAELTRLTIQPHPRYAVFPHAGPISAINETWRWIFDIWLPTSGEKIADLPNFELYDETFDPAVPGHVDIWIPLE